MGGREGAVRFSLQRKNTSCPVSVITMGGGVGEEGGEGRWRGGARERGTESIVAGSYIAVPNSS
jgi:hypothetical protein